MTAVTGSAAFRSAGPNGTTSGGTRRAPSGAAIQTSCRILRALTGSREIYEVSRRHPWSSVQFVTSHDGFTLHDLVSYNERHNEDNGEDNRDGHAHNLSWNGVEGLTDDDAGMPHARQKRNLLATLLLSVGTPMLLMGDELSRTQNGNNNAYAQDNETSWLDWEAGITRDRIARVRANACPGCGATMRKFPPHDVPERKALPGTGLKDVYWLAPEGREMSAEDWSQDLRRALGMQIGNEGHGERRSS